MNKKSLVERSLFFRRIFRFVPLLFLSLSPSFPESAFSSSQAHPGTSSAECQIRIIESSQQLAKLALSNVWQIPNMDALKPSELFDLVAFKSQTPGTYNQIFKLTLSSSRPNMKGVKAVFRYSVQDASQVMDGDSCEDFVLTDFNTFYPSRPKLR
ncbi:MAG: hypothetical protein COT74_11990 [Bdellovibrionales bacterium CG10_big_fil_rev_8_21_14_0_10_45_34]|nr:MAG: hypothetical protein COT74_11990 [Bdellovibrionales bacterium CG10_big_fil_rev_8_21_14_0_10_45_34]